MANNRFPTAPANAAVEQGDALTPASTQTA